MSGHHENHWGNKRKRTKFENRCVYGESAEDCKLLYEQETEH